jgi:hypothetical protein
MQSLGFENYTDALKIYLGKYREVNLLLNVLSMNSNSLCRLPRLKELLLLVKKRKKVVSNLNKLNSSCMVINSNK